MKTARQILIATKKRKNIPLIKYLTIDDICEGMEEYAKIKLKEAFINGFEQGFERGQSGLGIFNLAEDKANEYCHTQTGRV